MSDAFDVPTEISDVTIVGPLPLPVTGTITPVGTQDVNIVSSITLDVTGPLTDTELRATPVPVTIPTPVPVTDNGGSLTVDGSVAVTNFPATQSVTQGTTPWIVDGSAVVQPVSGTVTANIGTTNGLALDATLTNSSQKSQIVNSTGVSVDAHQIGSTPVATDVGLVTNSIIYGHTTAGGGGYVEVKVNPSGALSADVSGSSVSVTNFPAIQTVAISQTGTNNDVDATVVNGAGAAAVNIQDGGNSITVDGTVSATQGTSPWVISGTVTATPTGVQDVSLVATSVTQPISAVSLPLPTGAATEAKQTQPGVDIGDVTVNNATGAAAVNIQDGGNSITVDGTVAVSNFPATQPVSGTVTVVQPTGTNLHTVLDSGTLTSITNALPAGTNVIGHVITDSGSTTAVTGNVTVVQPTGTNLHVVVDSAPTTAVTQGTSPWVVSGTVTANLGTIDGAATEATLATRLADATFTARINTLGQKTSANSTPVVIASDQSAIPVSQSGTWTVQPGNTPNTAPWLIEQRAPGTITTYSASTLGLAAAATPTDIFTIYGSGTKTIRILRVEVSATQTSSGVRDVVLIKRSATNTGGTSAAATIVPHDSNNAAATATVLSYTANPAALGASVGNLRTGKIDFSATNLVGAADRLSWTFADRPGQAIVLRGTSQGVAVNLNGVTANGNSLDINIEWTEE